MDIDIEYLDEELEDIEYTEILSFEEMSRINPSFIAMDKEEIYNNLYTLFKNKKKSDLLRSLFYDILDHRESKNGKLNDFSNYVFAAEGEITKYGDDDTKDATLNFIMRYEGKNDRNALSEFVKRKFCVSYNRKSNKLRLKPTHNTTITLSEVDVDKAKDFPKYHQIVKDYPVINCRNVDKVENVYNINDGGSGGSGGNGDDINIPILGTYYKIPTATTNDYMYAKIASHLLNSVNTNYTASANYQGIYELIKDTRPDIEMIMSEINSNKESFYLDYGNINNIFKKYNYSLDFISEKDLEILTDLMASIIKKEKERKNTHGVFKIKRPILINKKLTFFDNIEKTLKVINISPEVHSFLEKTKDLILKYKSDIIQSDVIPLNHYNIFSIIKQINDNAVSIEEVIEDLRLSIKTINLEHTLITINDILEAKENIGIIKEDCDNVKNTFIHSREHIFDYDKDGKKYVLSKRETKAVCDANNIDDYEGLQDADDIIDDENKGFAVDVADGDAADGTAGVANHYNLNRYIANIHFRNEKGFIEILRTILELIKKINDVANIDIDYDEIAAYLFTKYRSVSTRYELYFQEFEKNNIDDAEKNAKKYAQMKPLHILTALYSKQVPFDKNHVSIIKKVNNEFMEKTNIIFCNAVCFWIVDTQDKILKGSVSLNMNSLNPNHLDKLNTRGLLYYIIEIISDFFKYTDDNDYVINVKDLRKNLLSIVENEHKDRDAEVLSELLSKKNAEGKNKCSIDRGKYTDDERYYIDKLLYMPNNNAKFEKIHKYIQGCCLRKLDINFNDNSDFNDDIISLKEQYSKVRLISKERDMRYTPPKERKKKEKKDKKGVGVAVADVDSDGDGDGDLDLDIFAKEAKEKNKHVKYVNKAPFAYNFKNYSVDEWLEGMRDKSELLPSDLIDNLLNYDIDSVKARIVANIKRLRNVINNISGDFLNCQYINYKEILLNICKILYMNANTHSNTDAETNVLFKEKIMESIKHIKKMMKHLYNLNKNYNAEEADVVNTINILVISNSLNYPDLSGIENIPKEFMSDNSQKLYEYIKSYVGGKYNRFLTSEEITVFINEKREEYKIKRLKENQDLDIEENEIRRQMKTAGIKVNKEVDADAADAAVANGDDVGDVNDAYKGEEKDKDYNSKDNDNYNIYDDVDEDMD